VISPVTVTEPLLSPTGSGVNEKLEKVSSPTKVSAVTPPTVPPLKPISKELVGISWGGIVHRVPCVHRAKTFGPFIKPEWMKNDGPERKKSMLSALRKASSVNVKVSATAEPLRKQTITREKTADLNDNPVMEASFSDFLPRRVKNYRHILSSAQLASAREFILLGSNDEAFPEFSRNSLDRI
jgi:hypothetical protein